MRSTIAAVTLAVAVGGLAPTASAVENATPLDLKVFVNGVAAQSAPGPDVEVGSTVRITYEVRNSSNQWLWSLYVYQDGVGRVTCPERHVGPNALVVCEATMSAAEGPRSYDAFATAWPSSGGVEDAEKVHFRGVSAAPPSGLVNLALGRPATQSGPNQWDTGTPATLAVDGNTDGHRDGGSLAITYRVSEAWWEVDLGKVQQIDHVVLWNRTDCCSERLQKFHVFVSDVPFEVKDIKNTKAQVGVLDRYQAAAAGRKTVVPVNRTGRYVRVQLDYVDAVLALAEVEVMGSTTVAPPPPPEVSLGLRVTVGGADTGTAPGPSVAAGTPLRFQYEVTNTGNRRLWSLYLYHDGFGRITCPSRNLAVGATVTCSFDGSAGVGARTDQVSAQAWDDAGVEASARNAVFYTVSDGTGATGPALDLEAFVQGEDADAAPGPEVGFGSQLAFTYRVRNTGARELWGLYVYHDGVGVITCPSRHLPAGATVECTRSAPAKAGQTGAVVTAAAWDAAGAKASDADAVHYTGVVPASGGTPLTLKARVQGADADAAPGPMFPRNSTVPMTFEVTNGGAEQVWGLWINLPGFGTVSCAQRNLLPGASTTCSASLRPPPGSHGGNARATAYNAAGAAVEALDPFHFFIPESVQASVRIDFLVDGLNGDTPAGPRIREGEVMTFSYLVANVGGVDLTGVRVTDSEVGAITCPRSTIRPGEVLVCTRTRVATLIETSVLATVRTNQNVSDTERLYYHVKPYGREDRLILEVTINGVDADSVPGPNLPVGSTAVIRYVLTNNANTASMWSAEILDPWVPVSDLRCSGGPNLGHNQSMVCTATIIVQAGQQSNLVVGHAWSNNGPRLDASDRFNYVGVA